MFVYLSRIEEPPPKRSADGSIPPTNAKSGKYLKLAACFLFLNC